MKLPSKRHWSRKKLYYRKKSAPFNLMDYYDADDSVKEKVQNLDIQVKKRTRWFVCLCQPCINRASYTAGTGSDPELSQQAVRRGEFLIPHVFVPIP